MAPPKSRTIIKNTGQAATNSPTKISAQPSATEIQEKERIELTKELSKLKSRGEEYQQLIDSLRDTIMNQTVVLSMQKDEINELKAKRARSQQVSELNAQFLQAMQMNGYGSPAMAQLNSAAQARQNPIEQFEMMIQQRMMQRYEAEAELRRRQQDQEEQEDPYAQLTYEQLLALQEDMGTVNVGLTQEQINSIKTKPYLEIEKQSWAICQNDIRRGAMVKILPKWDHMYHKAWISQWLEQKNTCPICQIDVI